LTGEGQTLTLPTAAGYAYTFQIDWGDAGADKNVQTFFNATTPVVQHTYATS
jgi:hypothetical protein